MPTLQPSPSFAGSTLLPILLALFASILSGQCRSVYYDVYADATICTQCGDPPLGPVLGCLTQGPHLLANGTCECACATCYETAPPCPGIVLSDCEELDKAQPNPNDPWQCCRSCKRWAKSNNTAEDSVDAKTLAEPTRSQRCASVSCPADPLCVEYEKLSVGRGKSCCPRCLLRLEPRQEVALQCWFVGCEVDPTCARYTQAIGEECCPFCIRRKKTKPKVIDRYDVCAGVRCPLGRSCQRQDIGRLHPEPVCSCKDRCKSAKERLVCGSDGNSYFSPCELYRHACLSGRSVSFKHSGPCKPAEPLEVARNSTAAVVSPTLGAR